MELGKPQEAGGAFEIYQSQNQTDNMPGFGGTIGETVMSCSDTSALDHTPVAGKSEPFGSAPDEGVGEFRCKVLMDGAFEVAQAIPADAQEIGALRAYNWREQYAHLDGVTEEWMNAEVERITNEESNSGRAHWIEQAARPDANNYWLVVRAEGGALAGFLEARRHDDGTQELRSLHLSPDQRGMGIGQALMDVARREWFDPSAEIFLDVAKVNEAGQRFYSRSPNNFELTDHTFFYGPVAMLQMKRAAET